MHSNFGWKYILLGTLAFIVVIVVTYLLVANSLHVPVVSLLPASPLSKQLLPPTPTPGVKPTSITRFTSATGIISYTVRGKFVTAPAYNPLNILQADFVIDQDPTNQRIPVIMTIKTGIINVGRSKGSLTGTTVWKLEDTESLRQAIKVNAPVQLHLQQISPQPTAYDVTVQKTMDAIIAGNWTIPADFVLHPPMVGIVE